MSPNRARIGGYILRKRIPLAKPFFTETEVEAVRETLKSGWVAQGQRVKQFEEKIAAYCGVKYGIATNSCTSALHLSLLAHNISEGNKVIVPDYTFTATGNVVLHVGAKPKIIDIDLNTLCIDVDKVKECIDDEVKAIIPVHTFGHPADINKLNKLAKKNDLCVIEDAASGLGSEIKGKKIGSYGNITCFSFQARKVITTGEGGMIVLDNDILTETLRALRSQGQFSQRWKQKGIRLPFFRIIGFSYRMSDIQAGIGLVQLDRIEEFIRRRVYLARYYNDLLNDAKIDVKIPESLNNIRHTYQAYVILMRRNNRDKVIMKLRDRGIESTIGTYSLSSLSMFKSRDNNCPNGEYAFKHSLALPMYHELSEDDIEYIVKSLKETLIK